MFDEKLWEEAYNKAKEEVKDMPVVVVTDRCGFRGERPIIFMNDVPVKGNKMLINKLKSMGWCTQHSMNVQGRRILKLEKTY